MQLKGKGRGLWFLIDDLTSLHKIPSLLLGLREGEQFGTSFVLAAQSISELRKIYGDDALGAMAENCHTRLVLATLNVDAANWCAKSLGKNRFSSAKETIESLVWPEDLQVLKPLTLTAEEKYVKTISAQNLF